MTDLEERVIELTVNEKQRLFFESHVKYQGYGGAKGGGKSWGIRTKQMIRRLKYPGSRGLTLRRTYPELLRTHIQKILVEWKGLGTWKQVEKTFTFHNGSVQEFGSCQYEHDVADYQGSEYDDIGIDEATQFTEYMIETLKTNIRTTRTDLKTQMYFGFNPGGVGHGYFKRTIVKEETRIADCEFTAAKVYDNHVLMQADPEYAKNLAKLPENLRRAFLDGDWDIFEGQALPEWRYETHVSASFAYPLDVCRKVVCFDRGYNAPGCALWLAFSPKDRHGVRHAYCYREIYQSRKHPTEWAKQLALYFKIEPVAYVVLPHDCFSHIDGNESYAQIFDEAFGETTRIVRGNTLASGARHQRLALLHDALAPAADGKPVITFHPNCKNTVRTLPELIVDEHDIEDVDTEGEDHAYDALTLGIMAESAQSTAPSGAIGGTKAPAAKAFPTVQADELGRFKAPDFWRELQRDVAKKSRR